jgi:hypothetical protein
MKFEILPPKYNWLPSGTVLADVANHCKQWSYFRVPGDQSTSAHEATHGVNADIRNANGGKPGFYCLEDRYVLLDEIKGRKRDALPFVPEQLKYGRFNLYVAGQTEWDSSPLYIFDEAIAYANGAACAIEIDKKSLVDPEEGMRQAWRPMSVCANHLAIVTGDGSDRIFGVVEFIAYCTATLMAAPKPLSPKLVEFSGWFFARAMELYEQGRTLYPWPEMEECMKLFQQSDDPKIDALRHFQFNELGFDITSEHQHDNYYV